MAAARSGFTVPLAGPLHSHREALVSLADAGYGDAWSGEADRFDGFTPLALAAAWEPRLRVGSAIVSAFTRSPAVLAQSAAAMADAAPGRFLLGVGASSKVIVEHWNGVPYVEPFKRTRDVVRFLRDALNGHRIARSYDTFTIDGFRLQQVPEVAPPVLVAALGPGMIRLAAQEADGVILNWLAPNDVRRVAQLIAEHRQDPMEIVARVFVMPTENRDLLRTVATRFVAAYLNVPGYAAAQRWYGRTDALTPMWEAWNRGDRKAALDVIPDAVIDDLIVNGSPSECRHSIQAYLDAGLTATSVSLLGITDPQAALKALIDLLPGKNR